MEMKEIDPVLRDLWLAWLKDAEAELMEEEPDTEMLLRHVQMLIEVLTPFPDVSGILEIIEGLKEGE